MRAHQGESGIVTSVNSVTSPPVSDALKTKLWRAAAKLDEWTAERDRLICEAMDAGASSREVAEIVGLSHAGVIKIWKRKSAS